MIVFYDNIKKVFCYKPILLCLEDRMLDKWDKA